jgi:hypothetical protein
MSENQNPFDSNLSNQITDILHLVGQKPRIVQAIQAHNEEGLIRECMLQLYDKVDQILVLEGAVANRPLATPDGHSTDRTVEIIKEVIEKEDPDDKFVFIQIQRPWNDLEEMKNTFFAYMREGDWMMITDVDEFFMPEVVDKLREAISIEPHATEFVPAGFYHFWRDARHIRKPDGDWGQQHQRFIRFQEGLHYRNHPVATDKDGVCTYFDPRYLNRRFVLPEFVVYHYSYCKLNQEEEIKRKKAFYEKELGQAKHNDVGAYARGGQTDEFLNKSESLDSVLAFSGRHPPILSKHSMIMRRAEGVNWDDLADYKEVEPYCLDKIPLIWIWAKEGREPYTRLFNIIDV